MEGTVGNPEPQTRDRIFSSALKLFAERGQASVSMREIAENANVSKPMLYYYFDSKSGLIHQLFREAIRSLQDGIERIDSQMLSPAEKIARIVGEVLTLADEAREMHKFLVDLSTDPALVREHIDDVHREFDPIRKVTARIIVEGQAQGAFRRDFDPEIASTLLFGVTNMFIGMSMRTGKPELTPELSRSLADLVMNGFTGNTSLPVSVE
jgi:TetR/AcrR family transcriptional regulator